MSKRGRWTLEELGWLMFEFTLVVIVFVGIVVLGTGWIVWCLGGG